ncbi:hypothetical protein A2U01_0070347, partial [Trifolium medium]|nr:hypothetical protein [Trifolium medium]
ALDGFTRKKIGAHGLGERKVEFSYGLTGMEDNE